MIIQWIPSGYSIAQSVIIGKMLYCSDNWQIYASTDKKNNILFITSQAKNKLIAEGILENDFFTSFDSDENTLFYIISDALIFPINDVGAPDNYSDALGVALALKKTRECNFNAPLQDSIYVEQYTILLPIWSTTEKINDELILGRYLTGGVDIPVSSFQRLSSFCNWLDKTHLEKIILSAGFHLKNNAKEETQDATIKNKDNKQGVFMLAGRPQLEKFFNDHIIDIALNSDRYKKMGIDFPSATILYGPPGCGKTYAAEKLVEFLDWPCFTISASSIASPYIHQTSKLISDIFEQAITAAPSVVLIDEMEAFVSNRNDSSNGTHHNEEVAEFLRIIPNAISKKVLILAMTNHLDMIDPAIRRTGRFDNIVEVAMPSEAEIKSLVDSLVSKRPIAKDINFTRLIEIMTGRPLSDTDYVIREAARIAAKSGKECIDQLSIDEALDGIPKQVTKEDIKKIGF